MAQTPRKLKKDAIGEAILEIRFEVPESETLPELVVGNISQYAGWSLFSKNRTPIADFPAFIRVQDPNLKYLPILELHSKDNTQAIKIGPYSIAYHSTGNYPGWDEFRELLNALADHCCTACAGFTVTRLGLRYVNLLNGRDHFVKGVRDLAYSVSIGGSNLDGPQNLNYSVEYGGEHKAFIRIATPEFVQTASPREFSVLVDVDVQSPEGGRSLGPAEIKHWVEQAHSIEKEEFFRLFPSELISKLEES